MEIEKAKSIIEAILFSCGRPVEMRELITATEIPEKDIIQIIEEIKSDYERDNRGIEIIKVNDVFQLTTKKEYYDYIYPIFDKRSKPNLSNAALETLSIIAYNPKITRLEIEAIRGVNSDGTMYKLLEYNLIESAGKADAPGKPTMYQVTQDFYRMFGFSSMDELPELPRYKLDENQQIVIDELIEENIKIENNEQETANVELKNQEAPMPEREEDELSKENIEKNEE